VAQLATVSRALCQSKTFRDIRLAITAGRLLMLPVAPGGHNMLSRETIEAYRRMSPSERLALTLRAMREALPYLLHGERTIVDRRFELIRRENDERNRRMLAALAEADHR
jgi:hypothetical protein